MPVCILTDSTVQFPNPVFEGRNLVSILPTRWEEDFSEEAEEIKAADLPESLLGGVAPTLRTASIEDYEENFQQLSARCDGILAILHSAHFNSNYDNAVSAAENLKGGVPIKVVDSKTTSLGLGMLVQIAAKSAEAGQNLTDLELKVRTLIPRIYSILCIPSLSYLERRGYLNSSQALVGEYLGMLPVFTLDSGELMPGEKARNTRHLVDILHEFLTEFSDLEHIALLQGAPSFEQETRALRERLSEDHGSTTISEQIIGAPLASLVGPRSLGVFALQSQ